MGDAPKKHAGGRPTKYRPEFCELAGNYCRLGATDPELAEFFDVCRDTIITWRHEHQEFSDAIRVGKDSFDLAKVEGALVHRALGYDHKELKLFSHEGSVTDEREIVKHYPPDTAALIFWLKNRQPGRWRDKQEIDHTSGGEKMEPTRIVFESTVRDEGSEA